MLGQESSEAEMLLDLRAENYAVIDHAIAQFGTGLNLMTGETGAGKSILIDALELLLGGKASADLVRHGAEKATVGCVFELTPGALEILKAGGINSEGDEIVLRREIAASAKGRVYVNNQPATVGTLRQLAPELALVHSQGETTGAFDAAQQRLLLDRFAGLATEEIASIYREWTETTTRLEELRASEQERLRMADLWRFQTQEISEADLKADDEDVQLTAEKRVLANAEKLHAGAMNAHDLLYESEYAAESTLGSALKHLEELARYDERFISAAQQLASAKAMVEDVDASVRDFAENVLSSPGRLEEIEERLMTLDRLKRKYGSTLAEVMTHAREVQQRLDEVDNRDQVLEDLRVQQKRLAELYRRHAARLTQARQAAAARLAKAAELQINDLAMRVRLEIRVSPQEDESRWSSWGWDEIQFALATNAGEPMKPLNEIASGGEMSRVMLALKVTVEEAAGRQSKRATGILPRTLVFDEIDIGIGGRAAEAVGRKLKQLSRGQQVICITHLPQIAAFADHHFLIEKSERSGRTRTAVRELEPVERAREIARMLSGEILTETSLRHAESLIDASR